MKTDVSSIIERPTKKQKKDIKKRIKRVRAKSQEAKQAVGSVLGYLVYRCSNCSNRVLLKEELGDRKILCTKCNAGVFKKSKK